MKAILIDPVARTVTETDYNGDYHHIYELTGCTTFEVAHTSDGLDIYVDESGLLTTKLFFLFEGYDQPLAGCGLILACGDEGDTLPCPISLPEAVARTHFFGDRMPT